MRTRLTLLLVMAVGVSACTSGLGEPVAESVTTTTPTTVDLADENVGGTSTTAAPVTTVSTPSQSTSSQPDSPPPILSSLPDAGPANAALPEGADLSFKSGEFKLDEDDGALTAQIVAPVGWKQSVFLGITFEAPEDSDIGFFTDMRVDTGCDGLCAPTDWEARLNGPDGYLTQLRSNGTVVDEGTPTGSEGAIVVATDDFGTEVTVLRWDDSATHYFKCEAQLDEDDDVLVDAFRVACEASRPGWFSVG